MAGSRASRRAFATATFVGLPLLTALAGVDPTQSVETEVVLAAVTEVRPQLDEGLVALDVSRLCTARLARWSCAEPVREALARLRMVPTSQELTRVCPAGARSCRLVGVRHLVVPAAPRVRGGSAQISVQVFTAASAEGGTVTERTRRLELTRLRGAWVVR